MNPISPRCVSLFSLGFYLLCSACSSVKGYSGEVPEGVKIARVRGEGVRFHSINDLSLGSFDGEIDVLPGKNSLRLSVNASNYVANPTADPVMRLDFEAAENTTYVVTGRRGDRRLCAWRLDTGTGEPVFQNPAGCAVRE